MEPTAVPQLPPLNSLPATLEQALQPSSESRIITEPHEPFRIVHVNDVWCRVCGFDAEEALGQTCRILQGLGTCKATLGMLRQALLLHRNFAVQLLNYTKRGRPFMNTLQVTPLLAPEGTVTHYLGVVIARFLDGGGAVPESVQLHSHPAPTVALTDRSMGAHDALLLRNGAAAPSFGASSSRAASEDGSSSGVGRVPPFLTKLSEILTTEPQDVIRLSATSASFSILDPQKFAKGVLPRYFKHNKLGSFSQQLHTYGFRRKSPSGAHDVVEFYHDRYSDEPSKFLAWIRSGGAQSKRGATARDGGGGGGPPPPELLQDLAQVHEGIGHLGSMFEQAKLTHAMQLRTILTKLMLRGILAPESATYIASVPPATPIPPEVVRSLVAAPGATLPATAAAAAAQFGSTSRSPAAVVPPSVVASLGLGSSGLSAAGLGGQAPVAPRPQSVENLQAQLDALESGLAPLHGGVAAPDGAANVGSHSIDLQSLFSSAGLFTAGLPWGDEALQFFADNAPRELRQPPYPVDAHNAASAAAATVTCAPLASVPASSLASAAAGLPTSLMQAGGAPATAAPVVRAG